MFVIQLTAEEILWSDGRDCGVFRRAIDTRRPWSNCPLCDYLFITTLIVHEIPHPSTSEHPTPLPVNTSPLYQWTPHPSTSEHLTALPVNTSPLYQWTPHPSTSEHLTPLPGNTSPLYQWTPHPSTSEHLTPLPVNTSPLYQWIPHILSTSEHHSHQLYH